MMVELTPELNGGTVTTDKLWEKIQTAWEKITPALCGRLASHLQEVVDNNGGWSHY